MTSARDLALAGALNLDRELARALDLGVTRLRARDYALRRDLDVGLDPVRALNRLRHRAHAMARLGHGYLERPLARGLTLTSHLVSADKRARALAHALENDRYSAHTHTRRLPVRLRVRARARVHALVHAALVRSVDRALDSALDLTRDLTRHEADQLVGILVRCRDDVRRLVGLVENQVEPAGSITPRVSAVALRLTGWAVRTLPVSHRADYREIFLSELDELARGTRPSRAQLGYAMRVMTRTVVLRQELVAPAPAQRKRSW